MVHFLSGIHEMLIQHWVNVLVCEIPARDILGPAQQSEWLVKGNLFLTVFVTHHLECISTF